MSSENHGKLETLHSENIILRFSSRHFFLCNLQPIIEYKITIRYLLFIDVYFFFSPLYVGTVGLHECSTFRRIDMRRPHIAR